MARPRSLMDAAERERVQAFYVAMDDSRLASARQRGRDPESGQAVSAHVIASVFRAELPRAHARAAELTRRITSPVLDLRVRCMERLVLTGLAPRDVRLTERSRQGALSSPFHRLWYPSADALAADIDWSPSTAMLFVRGRGPRTIEHMPVVRGVLSARLAARHFRLEISELFAAIWGTEHPALRQRSKRYVAVHRLRTWLEQRGGHDSMIETRDQHVGSASSVRAWWRLRRSRASDSVVDGRARALRRVAA